MVPTVISRETLHFTGPRSDKVYIIEVLERGGARAHFTSWGRRGRALTSKHVSSVDASRLFAEKLGEGYKSKASTVGLTAEETDLTKPITDASVYEPVLPPAAAPAPGPAATVEPPEPKALPLDELQDAFQTVLASSPKRGQVSKSQVTYAGRDFQVKGTSTYTVTLNPMACDCPSFKTRKEPCKHLVAVVEHFGDSFIESEREGEALAVLAGGMGIPEPPAPVAVGMDDVGAIFAPFIREDESEHDSLIPHLEDLVWDVKHARRIATGVKRRTPVLLFGPTQSGKTSMVRAFAAMTLRPFVRINMTPTTSVADLIGSYQVAEGKTFWQDGPLTAAARFGHVTLVDETDRMDPGLNGILFSLMEKKPFLSIKENGGEVVEVHPDFRLFLTANSLGLHDEQGIHHGTQAVDAALLSRCGVCIRVDYPDAATETMILVDRGIQKQVAERVVQAAGAIRGLIASGSVVGAFGISQSIDFAENSIDLGSYEEGFAATVEAAFTKDEFNTLWQATQRFTGTTL